MPRVPRELATVVLRCLAKDRAERPATYALLNDVLRPFSSTTPTPATIGIRAIAWAIEAAILSFPSTALSVRLAVNDFSTPW
jgi:hypothetical protein